jgi:hypothetical protein
MGAGPLIVILLFIGVWFFFLRTRATQLGSMAQFYAIVSEGQPVVVDFFANT